MPRVRIVLTEGGQGVEIELESHEEPLDAIMTKALRLTGGLGDWLDKKEASSV